MSFVLKIVAKGETQRVPLDGTPNYVAVEAAVARAFPSWHKCTLKYKDDEGDLCTLVESTFEDFLLTAGAIADTSCGALVLKVELFKRDENVEKPSSTTLNSISQRRNVRRTQPVARNEWACDPRDLDELVQQFTDPSVKKKARKKKSKPNAKADKAPLALKTEIDADLSEEALHDEEEYSTMPQQASDGALDDTRHSLTPPMETEASQIAEQEQDYETDDEIVWDARGDGIDPDTLDTIPSPDTLRRSASCPCTPTWLVEQESIGSEIGLRGGSLVAQSWPFVEEDTVPRVNLAEDTRPVTTKHSSDQGQEADLALWSDPIAEQMQQSYPAACGHVVWMPVLLPWAINDPFVVSQMGVPVAACH